MACHAYDVVPGDLRWLIVPSIYASEHTYWHLLACKRAVLLLLGIEKEWYT